MVRFARLPLSPYQRDIWVAAAQFPELDQYTIFSYDRFTGEVDTQALERALLVLSLFAVRAMAARGLFRTWLTLFASITLFLGVLELDFYREFHQRLNSLVFQYMSEDPKTVMSML